MAERGIVGIDMRFEEFGDEVGFLSWCRGFNDLVLLLVELAVFGFALSALGTIAIVVTRLSREKASHGLLFSLKSSGEVVHEGIEGSVEGDVIEDCKDEEDNHEDDGPNRCGDTEESDEAELGNVDTSEKVLESTGVYQALGIDVAVGDEENVVSVSGVEQGHSDGRESEDEGSDARVGNA